MSTTTYQLVKNPLGMFSVAPMPSKATLDQFYKEKYYQAEMSSYQSEYSLDELTYFLSEVESSIAICQSLSPLPEQPRLLDVGCGEGFFAAQCHKQGWHVHLCDYSQYGLQHHNPQLMAFFEQGDVLQTLEGLIAQQRKFELINLKNVLEHVIDPQALMTVLTQLLAVNGAIRIEVPNDYSAFQSLLQQHNKTDNTWFCPPEHLHYFNKDSLKAFVANCGLRLAFMTGDFPIEMYLANDFSNYAQDRSRGKQAHLSRVMINNYVFTQGVDKHVEYLRCMAEVGLSRNLTVYVTQ